MMSSCGRIVLSGSLATGCWTMLHAGVLVAEVPAKNRRLLYALLGGEHITANSLSIKVTGK